MTTRQRLRDIFRSVVWGVVGIFVYTNVRSYRRYNSVDG